MKRDVVDFISKCQNCPLVKDQHQLPGGLLKPLDIPTWMWECLTCDFVTKLPMTQKKHDSTWVIMDRSTKSVHFIPKRITRTNEYQPRLLLSV